MKAKLKDYIDTIFTDAPNTYRAFELKEEMYTDLCEKYDDLISEGKTPASAYHAVISGVGDISELIEELKKDVPGYSAPSSSDPQNENKSGTQRPQFYTSEERETMRKYKNRCAVMTAVAVALYILCWLPLVLIGALSDQPEISGTIGLVIMFLMIAVATGLFIVQGMTKPEFMRGKTSENDDDDEDDDDDSHEQNHREKKNGSRHPVYKAISSAFWTLTVVVYLGFSFLFSAWHYSWLIFLIATAIDNIIKACFELKS